MSTIQNEIDRIKESVADAYETVELMGGDVPSPDLQKIDTLSDSIATIKGGSGGGGSENILLNWDFRNPVNRSGSTTYSLTTTRCTVDSWYSENGCAVNVVDGGVTFDPKNDATCVFGQNVKEWELMKGKTVTFSALVSNVTAAGLNLWIYGVEGPVALPAIEVGNDATLYSITGTVDNGASSLRCGIQAVSSTATIKMIAAKLEYGSKQTLAKQNSDNVWEILDPPNYDLQYILCSQYDAVTSAWIGPQDKITGTTSQIAGFDANGNLAAVASAPVANAIVSDSRISDLDMNNAPRGKIVNYLYNNNVDQASYHSPMGELYGTTGETWYVVETFGVVDRIVQTAAAPYNHQRKFFIRFKHDTTWSPWREIASLSDIPTVSNPNLLLNWDFRNPVNRNGKTEYASFTGSAYTIDRWRSCRAITTFVNEGMRLIDGGAGLGSYVIDQIIEKDRLSSNIVTFSAIINGELFSHVFTGPGNSPTINKIRFSIINNDDYFVFAIYYFGTESITIQAVKLELGSTQTLAKKNASGEWEIIDPPNYDLQYLLTSQYSPINGAYVGIQHSNPNLLDNWYFADPINQRGETEYTNAGYGIDRWTSRSGNVKTELTSMGLKLTMGSSTQFCQMFESDFYEQLSDKVLTGSILFSDGTLKVGTFKFAYSDDNWNTHMFFLFDNIKFIFTKSHGVLIFGEHSTELEILAAKLELGPVQTLAHKEGDTWVLNDPPPNKQQELAKCQRYLQPIDGMRAGVDESLNGQIRYASDFKKISIIHSFRLAIPMRATPTLVNYDGKARIVPQNASYTSHTTVLTNASLILGSCTNERITINAETTSETPFNSSLNGAFGEFDFLNCITTPLLSAEL